MKYVCVVNFLLLSSGRSRGVGRGGTVCWGCSSGAVHFEVRVPVRYHGVAPGKHQPLLPAPRRTLPLSLYHIYNNYTLHIYYLIIISLKVEYLRTRGQSRVISPLAKRHRVVPRDLRHRVVRPLDPTGKTRVYIHADRQIGFDNKLLPTCIDT